MCMYTYLIYNWICTHKPTCALRVYTDIRTPTTTHSFVQSWHRYGTVYSRYHIRGFNDTGREVLKRMKRLNADEEFVAEASEHFKNASSSDESGEDE